MRSRLAALVLVVVLGGVVIVGCGGGSSGKSSTTTKRTTASSATAGGGSGSQVAACAEAMQILQPLSSAASTNDVGAVMQAGQSAIPRLRSLAQQSGVSAATQAALKSLANAVQAVVNGARGPDSGAAISSAAAQLGDSCA